MAQTHLSWPTCEACEGYGTRLLNAITHQRSVDPCATCGGSGRVKPDGWKDPVWQPPAADGSHDGWLIDAGTHPELQSVKTQPACDEKHRH